MARPLPRQRLRIATQSTKRTFTSTAATHRAATTHPETLLPRGALQPPPYPYGSAIWYKQQNTGLYGGKQLQFGHNVSEKNEIKTLRTWYPNIQRKWLFSDALGRRIRTRVSTRVLRTIDKVGGLDNYLLGSGTARLKELGEWGWRLRWAVLHADSVRARLETEAPLRAMLGLDESTIMDPVYMATKKQRRAIEAAKLAAAVDAMKAENAQSGLAKSTTPVRAKKPTKKPLQKANTKTQGPKPRTALPKQMAPPGAGFMEEQPAPTAEVEGKPTTVLGRLTQTVTGLFKRRA